MINHLIGLKPERADFIGSLSGSDLLSTDIVRRRGSVAST
jgi:hypothetical protein